MCGPGRTTSRCSRTISGLHVRGSVQRRLQRGRPRRLDVAEAITSRGPAWGRARRKWMGRPVRRGSPRGDALLLPMAPQAPDLRKRLVGRVGRAACRWRFSNLLRTFRGLRGRSRSTEHRPLEGHSDQVSDHIWQRPGPPHGARPRSTWFWPPSLGQLSAEAWALPRPQYFTRAGQLACDGRGPAPDRTSRGRGQADHGVTPRSGVGSPLEVPVVAGNRAAAGPIGGRGPDSRTTSRPRSWISRCLHAPVPSVSVAAASPFSAPRS